MSGRPCEATEREPRRLMPLLWFKVNFTAGSRQTLARVAVHRGTWEIMLPAARPGACVTQRVAAPSPEALAVRG